MKSSHKSVAHAKEPIQLTMVTKIAISKPTAATEETSALYPTSTAV